MKKVCIIGASGKLGQYMTLHALDLDYHISAVCREQSVEKLEPIKDRIALFSGATNVRGVIKEAVADCRGVLSVSSHGGCRTMHPKPPGQLLIMPHQTHVGFCPVGSPAIVGRQAPSAHEYGAEDTQSLLKI